MRKISKKWYLAVAVFTMSLFIVSSCSRDDNEETSGKARFEVSGNFSGALTAVYTVSSVGTGGGDSGNETFSTLPWSKEYDVKGQTSMGIGVITDQPGLSGQKITVKLFLKGKEVKSTSATANADGELNIDSVVYTGE